ncbi:Serpin (serine protease inhibitor) [Popillia japonica]|uniref:Serpin (Serine protease inhibitor) n=1 Tax=Popillia japonica TaxID=7064 RepID=A0AAW1L8X2_POPJA
MKLFYTALVITGSVSIICAISVPASINYLNSILYDVISKNESFIFSPFGAHSALSLAYQGADGQTKRTLRTVLFLLGEMSTAAEYRKMIRTLTSAKHVQLNIANKIYLQTGYQFKPHFRFIAEDFFYGEADTIDFRRSSAATEEINNWVKEKTHKRNIKLFSFADFGLDTQAVLVNAMYFSSAWSSPFNKKITRWDNFYVSDKETLTLPMMLQAGYFEYDELVQLDAKILSMRYKNRSFAMTIILPNSRTGINELEKKLPKYNLNMLQPKGIAEQELMS